MSELNGALSSPMQIGSGNRQMVGKRRAGLKKADDTGAHADIETGRPKLQSSLPINEETSHPLAKSQGKTASSDKKQSKVSPGNVEVSSEDGVEDSNYEILGAKGNAADFSSSQKLQAKRLRQIRACEGLLMANIDWLEMADYPDGRELAQARQIRDYWVFILVVLGVVALLGFLNLVPGWIAGSALGSFLVIGMLAIPSIRRLFFLGKSYSELMAERKMLEFRALNHIKLLEGKDGLIWRCAQLSPYNRQLEKRVFASIIQYSRTRTLMKHIKTRAHIRLYLLFILEAQKAYESLKAEYYSQHQENLAKGQME